MPIDTELEKLIINKNISKSQFIEAYENGLIGDNDLSFVDDNTEYDIIVDDFISDTSENAVQNKVIKAYVDTTEQDIISGYMEADSELQQQINAQAIVIANKQDKLISGTNIKTINNESILGDGNLSIKDSISVGIILPFAGKAAPSGYLLCDGSKISRTTYANLFKVIGTTYGSGDGSTTFALPNYSSARMVTSSTVAVKGTGMTLGFISSTDTSVSGFGITKTKGDYFRSVNSGYGATVGTSLGDSSQEHVQKSFGITKDSSKSGITGTASLASSCKFIIKY